MPLFSFVFSILLANKFIPVAVVVFFSSFLIKLLLLENKLTTGFSASFSSFLLLIKFLLADKLNSVIFTLISSFYLLLLFVSIKFNPGLLLPLALLELLSNKFKLLVELASFSVLLDF
jgi:hypothetical protein